MEKHIIYFKWKTRKKFHRDTTNKFLKIHQQFVSPGKSIRNACFNRRSLGFLWPLPRSISRFSGFFKDNENWDGVGTGMRNPVCTPRATLRAWRRLNFWFGSVPGDICHSRMPPSNVQCGMRRSPTIDRKRTNGVGICSLLNITVHFRVYVEQ